LRILFDFAGFGFGQQQASFLLINKIWLKHEEDSSEVYSADSKKFSAQS